ncbi:MAG: hypothetical protein J4N70_03635 [Chloroflexi bacterium]|nr:hypothetical protein [Chloroflexota bacterium]
MRYAIFGRDEKGRRWGGKLKFTLAEWVASTGLLLIAIGVTIAVTTSTPLALLPGVTYAAAVGMAYMVYRHYLKVRQDGAATVVAAKGEEAALSDSHPLSEAGWEDELTLDPPEWVDLPATIFKVVGARGICPMGVIQGDYLKVTTNGPVTPGLCPQAEAVLHMAAGDNSEVREWCCPVYDHLLVFKKLDKVS